MKKIQKTTIALMSTVLVAGLAAGCGKSEEAAGKGQGEASKKVVNLTMWGGVPAENGPQKVVDEWNAKNPDIQVKYERFVNDDAGNLKLDTALVSGQSVDLFVNYSLSMLSSRVTAKKALDLSTFKDYNIEEKIGPMSNDWKVDGKFYGVPTTKSRNIVWLNKNALDEAGLPVPPPDWTLNDLQTYAQKLKKDKRWGYLIHLSGVTGLMDGPIDAKGYVKADGTSNLDTPDTRKVFETYFNMMHTDKSMVPLGEQLTTKMPVETSFLKGESAMLGAGEFIFRTANNLKDNPRDFKIAFTLPPRVSDDKDYRYLGGLGDVISINSNSPNKEAAWKFLKWYADGGMLPMAPGGRMPASKDANYTEALKLLVGENGGTYDLDSLNKVMAAQTPMYNTKLPQQVMDIRREEYEKYFLKAQSLDDMMKSIVKRHNDYISKNKK
ncbi:extracellular solute-binding protein [Paenibacillus sp. GD4]|uniref:ABC transporter substrate-binding protein n=1 Tax=Paenibacillus sp. GD4 TaxID=3068890 RepID=UPI0027967BDC|nr:extracellular solute-binding protein [Paenibacillus sp. GD4]MDQ1913901.1 extracellular solute-binding protein [Paenibacillus sp. GD4]